MISNKKLAEILKHDLDGSRSLHDAQQGKIENWLEIYNGENIALDDTKGRSTIVWKVVKKQTEALVANISKQFIGGKEIIQSTAINADGELKAKIAAKAINHFWNNGFDSTAFIKTLTRNTAKEGTSFIRVAWVKEIHTDVYSLDTATPEELTQLQEKGFKVEPQEDGTVKVSKEKVVKNMPHSTVHKAAEVFIDPTATSKDEIQFAFFEADKSISDMKREPTYDPAVVARIERKIKAANKNIRESSDNPAATRGDGDFQFLDTARKKVKVYEVWGNYDLDGNGTTEPAYGVVALMEGDKAFEILKFVPNDTPIKRPPIIPANLVMDDFSIYGTPLADSIEDDQSAMTILFRGLLDNTNKSVNDTIFVKKNSIDQVNLDRLIARDPIVEINTREAIQNAVQFGNYNQVSPQIMQFMGFIEQNTEGMTGVSRAMQGIMGTEVKSASSNFSAVMTQSQIRLLDMSMSISQALKSMFKMWLELMVEYLDDKEWEKITGVSLPAEKAKKTNQLAQDFMGSEEEQAEMKPEFKNQIMQEIARKVEMDFDLGDFQYDIAVQVGTDGLKDIKISQVNMALQQVGSLGLGQVAGQVLLAELLDLLDRPKEAAAIRNYQPQPDAMAQEREKAEIEEIQAETAKAAALAEHTKIRSQSVVGKTHKDMGMVGLDQAKKQADIESIYSKLELEAIKVRNDKERNGSSTDGKAPKK